MTRLLVVAGEASGDVHGAQVVRALKARVPGLTTFGMGGPRLAEAGVELLASMEEVSVMGIAEVVPRLPRILAVLELLARAALERGAQGALLVDAPDFNLRLAARLQAQGVPVFQLVAPMVWAWREGRVKALRRLARVLCILPFEEAFLRQRGVPATYVGNPLLDELPPPATRQERRVELGLAPQAPTLAVLPGSRAAELRRLLAPLAGAVRGEAARRPGLQVVVPLAPHVDRLAVEAALHGCGAPLRLVEGQAALCLGAADVALVASGTATLEAALMGCPLVAVYRVAPLTYLVGRALVRLPFFCLVNLLAGRRVVPELLQGDVTPEAIGEALGPLWEGPERQRCLEGLDEVRASLGPAGAADRAAELVARGLHP